MYLDKVKKRLPEVQAELGIQERKAQIKPCTPQQVKGVERKLGIPLPSAYKEYLLWIGNGENSIMRDMYVPSIIEFAREDAIELMTFNNHPEPLPEDAIVFTMHDGYHFRFFRASDGDNPPIHQYYEGSGIEWNQFDSLESYLLNHMEAIVNAYKDSIKWRKDMEKEKNVGRSR